MNTVDAIYIISGCICAIIFIDTLFDYVMLKRAKYSSDEMVIWQKTCKEYLVFTVIDCLAYFAFIITIFELKTLGSFFVAVVKTLLPAMIIIIGTTKAASASESKTNAGTYIKKSRRAKLFCFVSILIVCINFAMHMLHN